MLMPSHRFPPWPSLPWQGALVARQAMDISCIAISPKLKLASYPKNVPSGSKGPLELMALWRHVSPRRALIIAGTAGTGLNTVQESYDRRQLMERCLVRSVLSFDDASG